MPTPFQPYVPAHEKPAELSFRALALGIFFGVVFGGVTTYVGLKAGLTVAASIPIAVLSISVLRALGKATILENNIVQTTGNAGQSIASGVIFTLPALIFLGFDLEYSRIFMLALIGGWLGVLFMIPLRRQLIVEEHGTLTYPEGTACADVLLAGERGGSFASRVFLGLGLGGVYALFQNENLLGAWPGTPNYQPDIGPQHLLRGGAIRADATAEYLGVGYIIGPRVAGVLLAGGVFSWLVLMPAIYFFGKLLTVPVYPGTILISAMTPSQLWSTYIRPMGAGAVAAAGVITLLRTAPTIWSALRQGVANLRQQNTGEPVAKLRTDDDLSMTVVLGGSLAILALMWVFLEFKPVPGAQVGALANLAASLLVLVFGFLFVTVASRIVGLIGSSASPVSGMTIATLMATSAIFLVKGWTAPAFGALAITIGGVVCVAASNAGDTSQDLKTGFLIGATPRKQQIALMIGVCAAVFSAGITLNAMNKALEEFHTVSIPVDINALPSGVVVQQKSFAQPHIRVIAADKSSQEMDGTKYELLNSLGSATLADGKYLYNPATQTIEVQWVQGIGSEKAAAPQARLMATVINGILSRKLPWGLVLLGVALVIAVELLGIRSLSFAVGAYLSIGTTLAMFVGGMVRWMVDNSMARAAAKQQAAAVEAAGEAAIGDAQAQSAAEAVLEAEVSPGALYASGLIAAGGIIGLSGVALKLYENISGKEGILTMSPHNPLYHDWIAVLMFALLAFSLYYFARKPIEKK